MRVYIAAPYVRKADAKDARLQLAGAGIECCSRWLDFEDGGTIETTDPAILRQEGIADVRDMMGADALVLLNLAPSEGKSVEMGMALALAYYDDAEAGLPPFPILVVGKPSNIFHYHPYVTMCDNLEHAIRILTDYAEDNQL